MPHLSLLSYCGHDGGGPTATLVPTYMTETPSQNRRPCAQVRCCFRCCLHYWQHELKLDAMYEARAVQAANHSKHSFDWEHIGPHSRTFPAWDEVALTRSSVFIWANFLMNTSRGGGVYIKGPRGPKARGVAAVDRRRGFGQLLETDVRLRVSPQWLLCICR